MGHIFSKSSTSSSADRWQADPSLAVRTSTQETNKYPTNINTKEPLDLIRELWLDPILQEAVILASPNLANAINKVLRDEESIPNKKIMTLRRSLLKYAIRISTRPTPFGLFAAVSSTSFGNEFLVISNEGVKSARIAQSIVMKLQNKAEMTLENFCVSINPTTFIHGDRLHAALSNLKTESTNSRVDVRINPALDFILNENPNSMEIGTLRTLLIQKFGESNRDKIHGLPKELIRINVLVTDISSSAFDSDPAEKLIKFFPDELDPLIDLIDRYSATPLGSGQGELLLILEKLGKFHISEIQRGIQVDYQARLEGNVPNSLKEIVPTVFDGLCRLTSIPSGSPNLSAHADRFLEKYGETEVSLLDALDLTAGIGMPAGYETSSHKQERVSHRTTPELTSLLSYLIEESRSCRKESVEISPELVSKIPYAGKLPSSADLFIEMHENNQETQYALGATGVAFPAGRSIGRFGWGNKIFKDQVKKYATHDQKYNSSDLILQLEYLTNSAVANDLFLSPLAYDNVLILTKPSSEACSVRTVHDLLLGVHDGKFYVRDILSQKRVIFRRLNLVTSELTTDLVRFLEDISNDGFCKPSWSWGALEGLLDFYPGVTYAGIQLSSAKWRIPTEVKNTKDLKDWMQAKRIPRYLLAGEGDNQLLVDSQDETHLDLLMREVKPGYSLVQKALDPKMLGYARSKEGESSLSTEVIVSVLNLTPNEEINDPLPKYRKRYDPAVTSRFLSPGDDWWYFNIYCDPQNFRKLFESVYKSSSCVGFFVRYNDGKDHLRLRLRDTGSFPLEVSNLLVTLKDERQISEWTICSYEREIERYGGPETIKNCESLWCIESKIVALHEAASFVDSAKNEEDRIMFGVPLVLSWLDSLQISDRELHEMLLLAIAGYKNEFSPQISELNKKSRKFNKKLVILPDISGMLTPYQKRISYTMNNSKERISSKENYVEKVSMNLSLLHMWCNRLGFKRHEEYVLAVIADKIIRDRIYKIKDI